MTHSKTQLPDGISQEILTRLGAHLIIEENRPAIQLPTKISACNLGVAGVRSGYQLKGSEVLKST